MADEPQPTTDASQGPDASRAKPGMKGDLKWAVSLMLLVILAVSSFTAGLWMAPPQGEEHLGPYETVGGHTSPGIAGQLFDTWLVAFEVLGVLLLAALVGAIVIALRESEGGDA